MTVAGIGGGETYVSCFKNKHLVLTFCIIWFLWVTVLICFTHCDYLLSNSVRQPNTN